VSGARRGEHRLGVAGIGDAMVDDVAQELRAGQTPCPACRVAMQLPKTFSRRNQQVHATRRRLAWLRHDVPPSGVAVGLPKLRFRARADKCSASFDVATISGTIYDLSLIAC
jgi:hypothetical protein